MRKISLFLSILTLLLCSLGVWKLNSVITNHNEMQVAISVSEKNLKNLEVEIEEFSKEHAARFSRERRKNQDMEEQILNFSTEKTKLEITFSSKNSVINDLKASKEEKEKKILEMKVEIRANAGELASLKQKALDVDQEIPQIEKQIQENEMQCENEKSRSIQVEESLSNYAEITKVLKEHQERTLDSLYSEKYERPWIEEGEMIQLKKFSLDLDKGLLGLPVGQEIGLEPGAFFSIAHLGELICKIRIKEAEQNRSVALIMPLFGNPRKLLELESFDLKHL
jgi:chromosome segregation ATPase